MGSPYRLNPSKRRNPLRKVVHGRVVLDRSAGSRAFKCAEMCSPPIGPRALGRPDLPTRGPHEFCFILEARIVCLNQLANLSEFPFFASRPR